MAPWIAPPYGAATLKSFVCEHDASAPRGPPSPAAAAHRRPAIRWPERAERGERESRGDMRCVMNPLYAARGWAFQVGTAPWIARHMGHRPEKPLAPHRRQLSCQPPSPARRSAPPVRWPDRMERAGRRDGILAQMAVRRFGPRPAWHLASMLTRGLLICNTSRPLGRADVICHSESFHQQ